MEDFTHIVDRFIAWFMDNLHSSEKKRRYLLFAQIIAGRIERDPSALEHVIMMFELAAVYPCDTVISKLYEEFKEMPVKNKSAILRSMEILNFTEDYQKRSLDLLRFTKTLELNIEEE